MMTIRQIERLWTSKSYGKLYQELTAARPEAMFGANSELANLSAVSAMAMIRLEELSQSHMPLYSRLLRTVLSAQEADGDWGDLRTTALCVRALLCDDGDGIAIDHGLAYLANLQKPEGIWPAEPLRRMPEDPAVSLFVLYQLGDSIRFRAAVRFEDAAAWFESRGSSLDPTAKAMWNRTKLKCRQLANTGMGAGLFAA
jgi:hypothetical protein